MTLISDMTSDPSTIGSLTLMARYSEAIVRSWNWFLSLRYCSEDLELDTNLQSLQIMLLKISVRDCSIH